MTNKWIQRLICLYIMSLSLLVQVQAQLSKGGTPISFTLADKSAVEHITMPAFDVDSMLQQDDEDIRNHVQKPWRFGYNHLVSITPSNAGTWQTLPDGGRLWRLGIVSDNAYSINLTFSRYRVPPQASLFIYNSSHTDIIGAFGEHNNQASGAFATMPVSGSSIVVEYYEPAHAAFAAELEISMITHAYRDIYNIFDKGFGSSGGCNNNANCPEGADWQEEKRSVAMLVSGGSGFCSGALINNTSEDGKPLFLTANHCYTNAANVVFWFNWESPDCAKPSVSPPKQSLSGATTLTRHRDSDFWLMQINDMPPPEYNVFLSGWDRTDIPAAKSVGIHHPAGDIKKISFDNDSAKSADYEPSAYLANSHWKVVDWDDGTTEGGSSGSPVFDQNHRIKGQLHGGWAACGNNSADYYGKLFLSWVRGASQWLDPIGTGAQYINGIDPYRPKVKADMKMQKINEPLEAEDDTVIVPRFLVSNNGQDTCFGFTVGYWIDNRDKIEKTITDTLRSKEVLSITFDTIIARTGNHTITAYVRLADTLNLDRSNDTLVRQFYVRHQTDVQVKSVLSPVGVYCSSKDKVQPSVVLKNVGLNQIDSLAVRYIVDNNIVVDKWWKGKFLRNDTLIFRFDSTQFEAGNHVIKYELLATSSKDENPDNDTLSAQFNIGVTNQIVLNISTDSYASETSWRLYDSNNNVLYQNPVYQNNKTYTHAFCLPNGCYRFVITDKNGDGIINVDGYKLLNMTLGEVLAQGTRFGFEKATDFCVFIPMPQNDVAALSVGGFNENYCEPDSVVPFLVIKNRGLDTLTSLDILYNFVGEPQQTVHWTGRLAFFETDTILLPKMWLNAGVKREFKVVCSKPNNTDDFYTGNNTVSTQVTIYSTSLPVKLELLTDAYPGETSWSISDLEGNIIYRNPALATKTLYTHYLCFPRGCYRFVINDEYGDGLNGGYFRITDLRSNSILSEGSDFGSIKTADICYIEEDAAAIEIKEPYDEYCTPATIRPQVQVRNSGETSIFSLQVAYQLNTFADTVTWTGNLSTGDLQTIEFPAFVADLQADYEIVFTILTVNNVVDLYTGNNTISKSIRFKSGNSLSMQVHTDNTNDEFIWHITDVHNNELYSGNINQANQHVTYNMCVTESCYKLDVNDNGNNGICCDNGNGSYLIIDHEGDTLVRGGKFNGREEKTFCTTRFDASADAVIEPKRFYCNPTNATPQVVIRNNGKTILNNAVVGYTLDSFPPVVKQWDGALHLNQTDTVLFDNITLTSGQHAIRGFVTRPNGEFDQYKGNDSVYQNFAVYASKNVRLVLKKTDPQQKILWSINDGEGFPVYSGSLDASRSAVDTLLCIDTLCHRIEIRADNNQSGTVSFRLDDTNEKYEITKGTDLRLPVSQRFCPVPLRVQQPIFAIAQVFPNPSSGKIYIRCYETGDYRCQITDIKGSLLYQAQFRHHAEIDISHLDNGFYIMQLASKQNTQTLKILLQK